MLVCSEEARARALPPLSRRHRQVLAGAVINEAQTWGKSWRLIDGAIRLDHPTRNTLVRLALPGDLIGAEVWLKGHHTLNAKAILPCLLEPWSPEPAADTPTQLLQALMLQQENADEQWGLRTGSADARIKQLLLLLTRHMTPDEHGCVCLHLPSLQDLSDVLAQTIETTSRSISRLRASDVLQDLNQRRFSLRCEALHKGAWL